nr:hypothetical protein [Tanacetum cinerariifolium]
MNLFAFITYAGPTKARIEEREVAEGEVLMLQLTRGRVVPLAGVNDQEDGKHVIDVGGIDVVADDEVQAIVADKPNRIWKKRKAADGAGVVAVQSLLERSTLPVEVGVAAATTMPFVTSSVTLNSISKTGLRTRHIAERSSMRPLSVLTTAVATTVIAVLPLLWYMGQVPDKLNLAYLGIQLLLEWPRKMLLVHLIMCNVVNDSALDDPKICQGMIVQLAPLRFFFQLRGMDNEQLLAKFNVRAARQEKDAEISSLKTQLSLKEAEAAKTIRLRRQIVNVEVAKAAKVNELNDLRERNVALKGQVAALESAAASKDAELASSNSQVPKVTQDLSNLQLSCDELSVNASSLEFEKDKLIGQVSALKTTSSGLHDEVMGYKLFKEHVDAIQDVQVKEFYPRYLTTIVGRRWILSRGLILVVMKCLPSPDYLAALKAGRVLAEVVAYDPAAEANYVVVVNALRAVNFPFLAQLNSHKDSSMADLMDLFGLEGHAAQASEAEQLQPSPDQLMLPIHRLEDKVVTGETSLSFSLDLAYAHAWKLL